MDILRTCGKQYELCFLDEPSLMATASSVLRTVVYSTRRNAVLHQRGVEDEGVPVCRKERFGLRI